MLHDHAEADGQISHYENRQAVKKSVDILLAAVEHTAQGIAGEALRSGECADAHGKSPQAGRESEQLGGNTSGQATVTEIP